MIVTLVFVNHLEQSVAPTTLAIANTMGEQCNLGKLSSKTVIRVLVDNLARSTALTNNADVLTKAEPSTLGLHSTEMSAINVLVCRMDSFNAQTTRCHATASTAL